jgi:hypothetical protein
MAMYYTIIEGKLTDTLGVRIKRKDNETYIIDALVLENNGKNNFWHTWGGWELIDIAKMGGNKLALDVGLDYYLEGNDFKEFVQFAKNCANVFYDVIPFKTTEEIW